jgi:Predicted pPIWI-associating nuclease/REase_AHJR-like
VRASAEYLEAAKGEEVAQQLAAQGYDVVIGPNGPEHGYDLIATKGSEKLAIEVVLRHDLGVAKERIQRLRKQAHAQGYEFRLVVASPPHEVAVDVEGLGTELLDHMISRLPNDLDKLPPRPVPIGVTRIEIDRIQVAASNIRVVGSGIVEAELHYDRGKARDGATVKTDFPFTFDVALDRDLHLEHVEAIHVDTSSFDE